MESITEDGFDTYDTESVYKGETDKEESDEFLGKEDTEDDYSDENDVEVETDSEEFEGLAIYQEDEME